MIHRKPYDHPELVVVKLNSPVLLQVISGEESFYVPNEDFIIDGEVTWLP